MLIAGPGPAYRTGTGTVAVPSQLYTNNMACTWVLTAAPGTLMRVTFAAFNVGANVCKRVHGGCVCYLCVRVLSLCMCIGTRVVCACVV
jgi:hypothetical protein